MANELTDISLLFEEIIDTPAKRRKEVEAAGIRAQERFRQANRPFSLLAGGIASGIPRQTENIRNTMKGFGFDTRTGGERLSDKLKGVDLTQPGSQAEILRMIREVDPGKAAALEDMYAQREIDREANEARLANRFQVDSERYANGTTWARTATGGVEVSLADGTIITDPKDISTAIADGRKSDIDDARAISAAAAEGTASVAQLKETGEQLEMAMSQAQRNRQFITLLEDEGADATLWAKYTPAFLQSESTIEFNQLARQAGLDVVGSVTFGALSKAERDLAMDTAVPRFKTNEAAANFFRKRQQAQLALASELSAYLNFQRANEGKYANKYEFKQDWDKQRESARKDREQIEAEAAAAIAGEIVAANSGASDGSDDADYQAFRAGGN